MKKRLKIGFAGVLLLSVCCVTVLTCTAMFHTQAKAKDNSFTSSNLPTFFSEVGNPLSAETLAFTQSTSTDITTSAMAEEPPVSANTTVPATSPATDSIDDLLEQYYTLEAERESYKQDKDRLERQRRDGTLSQNEYYLQRQNLSSIIDHLHTEKDAIWTQLLLLGWDPADTSSDVTALTDQELRDTFYSMRQQQDEVDRQKHLLESQYYLEQVSREDFVEQYAEWDYKSSLLHWQMQPYIRELNSRRAWNQGRYHDGDYDWYHYDWYHDRDYYKYHDMWH